MKISKIAVMLVVLAIALTGIQCKKSEDITGVGDISAFVGAWIANGNVDGTKMTIAKKSNPAIKIDMFLFQSSIAITVLPDNSYTLVIVVPPLELDETETGSISIDGNKIIMTTDGDPPEAITFTYSFEGDFLSLVDNDNEFDFDLDGVDEPAIFDIILKKVVD